MARMYYPGGREQGTRSGPVYATRQEQRSRSRQEEHVGLSERGYVDLRERVTPQLGEDVLATLAEIDFVLDEGPGGDPEDEEAPGPETVPPSDS